ncbi:transmembrane protein, putative (macronuclear) [Tetrahymena thermophila SB210]|uniref:Transmembrane protein, putative n=1 Tax=Tetrahymena thermophila (strain SB210) TaxID=312017 RepID=Q24DI3_TETTS|nr:transmembrane protein, putative [Tetrahymena thermophila SB210]EAS05865.2 transmembrane protein, putative [Tetrahymena thermophila SB210]|eukprot:XP_001026110.2 transmembrane protein, putative [Tetrahymena thermophila SB210]
MHFLKIARFIFTFLWVILGVKGLNCPNIEKYDNPVNFYKYIVQNMIVIPKTNIMIINTMQQSSSGSSYVYYIDLVSAQVINTIKPSYQITSMKYHQLTDKIVVINKGSILMTDPYTLKVLKSFSAFNLFQLELIEATNYIIVSLFYNQCWVVDVDKQNLVIDMDNSYSLESFPDKSDLNQNITKFITLSTGQTIIVISNDRGLIYWTIDLNSYTYQWGGFIKPSIVRQQGDQYWSFSKHPTKDILILVGAYQQILVLQIVDIVQGTFNTLFNQSLNSYSSNEFFINMHYIVLEGQDIFVTNLGQYLYKFNVSYSSDFTSLTVSYVASQWIDSEFVWTPYLEMNSIFIASGNYISIYNYKEEYISYMLYFYGNRLNRRFISRQDGETDKIVLLGDNQLYLYERNGFGYQHYDSNKQKPPLQYYQVNDYGVFYEVRYTTNQYLVKTGDGQTDYMTTFQIYPLNSPENTIDIHAKYGLYWTMINQVIDPFFFNNAIWVSLPEFYKSGNYIISLVNCQSGEIYNLKSNSLDDKSIYIYYSFASLDDPDNQELIAIDTNGNIYSWDLSQPNFPFKFSLNFDCKNIYSADILQYQNIKRLIMFCPDNYVYSIDYLTGKYSKIVQLTMFPTALKAISRLQLVLIGDFNTGFAYVFKYDPVKDQFDIFLKFKPTKTSDQLNFIDITYDNTLWIQYQYSNVFYSIGDCLNDPKQCLECTQQYYFNATNLYDQNGLYGSGQIDSPFTTSYNFFSSMIKAQFYQSLLFNVSNMNVEINISPGNTLILNPNFMNFDFNDIISLIFQSSEPGVYASIQYSNNLQLQDYNYIGFKDTVINFDLAQNNTCGLSFLNIQSGVLLNNIQLFPLVKPSQAQSCQYIYSDSSPLSIQNYQIQNEDFTYHQSILSSFNNNDIKISNFSLINCTLGDNFSILRQISNVDTYIDNLNITDNKCSNISNSNNTSFLFTAGLFQVNGMTMNNNKFCRKSIFSTVVSLQQSNYIFQFINITSQNNTFQVRTTYVFFNALYSLLIQPDHQLILQNVSFTDNLLSVQDNKDLKTAQYFETIKISSINMQSISLLNHFDIQLGLIQNTDSVTLINFNCSNNQTYLLQIPNQLTASCLQLYEVLSVGMQNINIYRKKAFDSSLIFIKNFFTQQSTFNMKVASFQDLSLIQSGINTYVSPIYIQSSYEIDVEIDQAVFQNISLQSVEYSLSYSSLALQVTNYIGTFVIKNSYFLNSYSQSIYGFVYAQTNTLVLDAVVFNNQTFYNNQKQQLFQQYGGFVNAQIENLNVSKTTFNQSTSIKGGFLYLLSFGKTFKINMIDTIFNEGYASTDGGAIFIDSGNNQVQLNCINCQFSNIYTLLSQACSIGLQKYSQTNNKALNSIIFQAGYIKNSKGILDNYFIDVVNTNLQFLMINQILSEVFESDSQPYYQYSFQSSNQQPAILSNLQNSILLIQSCNISNLQKNSLQTTYPLLINSHTSNITIQNTNIENLAYVTSTLQLVQSQIQLISVKFKNINQLTQNSRLIQSQEYQIPSQNAATLISAIQSSVNLSQNSLFQNVTCSQNCNGGALQIQQGKLNIQETTFQNVSSNFGGAIYIQGLNQTNIIFNSQFISCQSQNDGGAIYLNAQQDDQFQLTISQSKFSDNSCQARGGAIYVNSQTTNLINQNVKITDSKIIYNKAAVGAGVFQQNISIDQSQNNIISANKASISGDNSVSYPTKLKIMNLDKFIQTNNAIINNQIISVNDFRSGANITDIEFILVNDHDEIFFPITQDQQNTYQVNVQFDKTIKKLNSYVIGEDTYAKYDPKLKAFKFSNISLSGIPQTSVNLQFTSDQIYSVDPKDNKFVQNYQFNLTINFRSCGTGEQITQLDQVTQCQICPENQYSFKVQNCQECPKGATCLGGSNIVTNAGYWRKSNDSDLVLSCNNLPDNCKGGSFGDNICYEGHIGALCEECDIYGQYWTHSYAKSAKFSCTRCDQIKNNVWIVVLMTIWTLISMCLAIKGDVDVLREKIAIYTIQKNLSRKTTVNQRRQSSAQFKTMNFSNIQGIKSMVKQRSTSNKLKMEFNKNEDKSGIFIKMLTNYVQIVGSIATFNLSIPSGIFEFPQSLGQPLKQTMNSLDCALQQFNLEMPIIYVRLLFSLTLPVIYMILFVLCMIIYYLIKYLKHRKEKSKNQFPWYILTTAIIFLIIYVQPDLVAQTIALLSCRQIGDTNYILSNVSFVCYTHEHYYYSFTIVLPMLISWVIIIPAFLFLVLRKNKNNLESIDIKLKYGFLYKEYQESAFYWEFVKMIEKLAIILSLNFYSQSVVTKAVLVFIVISAYGILSLIIHPYQESDVNEIDVNSTNVCAVTVLLGLFMYNNQYPYFVYTSLGLIVIINVWFIIKILSKIINSYKSQMLEVKEKILTALSKKFNYFKKFINNEKKQHGKIKPETKKKFQQAFLRFLALKPSQKKQIYLAYLQKNIDEYLKNVQGDINESNATLNQVEKNQEDNEKQIELKQIFSKEIQASQNNHPSPLYKHTQDKQGQIKPIYGNSKTIFNQTESLQLQKNMQNELLQNQVQLEQDQKQFSPQIKKDEYGDNLIHFNNQIESIYSQNQDEKSNADQYYVDSNKFLMGIQPKKTLSDINFQQNQNAYYKSNNKKQLYIEEADEIQYTQQDEKSENLNEQNEFNLRSPHYTENSTQRNQYVFDSKINLLKDNNFSQQNHKKDQRQQDTIIEEDIYSLQHKIKDDQESQKGQQISIQIIEEKKNNNAGKRDLDNQSNKIISVQQLTDTKLDLNYNTCHLINIQNSQDIIYDQDIEVQVNK